MPPAIIAAAITAAAAAATIGTEAAGVGQPSQGKELQQQEAAAAMEQQKATQQQEQAAWKRFAPNAQAQAGAGLSGGSFAQLVQQLAGYSGGLDQTQQVIFGNQNQNTGGTGGLPSGGQGLAH